MFELVSLVLGVVVTEVLLDVETQVQEQEGLVSPAVALCPDPPCCLECPYPPLLVVVGPGHLQQAPEYGQPLGLLLGQSTLGAVWEDYLL